MEHPGQEIAHLPQSLPAVANAVLLLRGQFGKSPSQGRIEKNWVVAEAVPAAGFQADPAFSCSGDFGQGFSLPTEHDAADESRPPFSLRKAMHQLEDFGQVARVVGLRPRKAGGGDPRRAA